MNNGIHLAISHYSNAFITALKDHLRNNVPNYTESRSAGNGCPTCGFGADEYQDLNIDALNAEIDKFTSQFNKEI